MSTGRRWLAGWLAWMSVAAVAAPLPVGTRAPGFAAKDQHGNTVKLADFLGKANVVLYFYPKDDTPGCTAEACSLRDGYSAIQATGAVVLGVSADSADSHAGFAGKYGLPFSILADPEGDQLIKPYGVRMPVLGFAWRVTFIIDKSGIIRDVIQKVDTSHHDKQVLDRLGSL